MARKCPRGFVCTDGNTVWLVIAVAVIVGVGLWWYAPATASAVPSIVMPEPKVIVMQQPPAGFGQRPDLYPEPVRRFGGGLPSIPVRGAAGPYEQVGILTQEGGSSTSAAPDRTILPLYGRELDPRRSRWNYYTRTDGTNPVQVPVRFQNRICDDDTNGCMEISSDDSIHVPALGRAFKATVYRKSMFN
jgi:hypothetical protein